MNSWVLTTLSVTDEITNGPSNREVFHTVKPVAIATASVAPRPPNRSAARTSGREHEVGDRLVAVGDERAERDDRHSSSAPSTGRSAHHARGGGRRQTAASGTSTSAAVKSPSHQVRQTVPRWSASITPPASWASVPIVALASHAGDERGQHGREPPDAAERPAGGQEAAQQPRRADDLDEVAGGLGERGADRQRAVVVDEQVRDQHARPQAQATQVQRGDPHAGGQPDDRRDRAGDLERVHQLGRGVVRGGDQALRRAGSGATLVHSPVARGERAPRLRPGRTSRTSFSHSGLLSGEFDHPRRVRRPHPPPRDRPDRGRDTRDQGRGPRGDARAVVRRRQRRAEAHRARAGAPLGDRGARPRPARRADPAGLLLRHPRPAAQPRRA